MWKNYGCTFLRFIHRRDRRGPGSRSGESHGICCENLDYGTFSFLAFFELLVPGTRCRSVYWDPLPDWMIY